MSAVKKPVDDPVAEPLRWNLRKLGLGYELTPDSDDPDFNEAVAIRVTRLKRKSQELHAFIAVECRLAGVKTVDGTLHFSKLNLSVASSRSGLGKLLTERTPGYRVDWADALEHLAQGVDLAESAGEPVIEVGNGERRRARPFLDPLAPANVVTWVYAPGGSGKSYLLAGLAATVGTGASIVPGIAAATQAPVLYLDWETDRETVESRLWAICRGAGVKLSGVLYRKCNRPLADDAESLSILAAERGVQLLVVDSCGPAMGTQGEYGDANESTLKLFEAIRHVGVTTIVIDHVSKQDMRDTRTGKVVGATPYGSVYKLNMARRAWELRPVATDDEDSMRVVLHNTKSNDTRLLDPIPLRVVFRGDDVVFERDDIVEEDVPAPRPKREGSLKDLMVEAVEAYGKPMPKGVLAKALGLTQSSMVDVYVKRYPALLKWGDEAKGDARTVLPASDEGRPSNIVLFRIPDDDDQ